MTASTRRGPEAKGAESALKVTIAFAAYFDGGNAAQKVYADAIMTSLERASEALQEDGLDIALEAVIQDTALGRTLPRNIAAAVDASSCLVLDLSEAPAMAHYGLGYAEAANVPYLVVARRESVDERRPPGLMEDALLYEDEAELSESLAYPLTAKIKEALSAQRISPSDRDFVWFAPQTEAIHVVASRSTDELYSADPEHRNHVYLEQFSDKDSVLELMVFLSRNYTARVHKYTSAEFPSKQLMRDNLVVVGGPGIDDILPGNPICREMTARIRTRLTYAPDGESLTLQTEAGTVVKEPVYEDGRLLVDYGYFARFPNPFEPSATVVMVHGLHTAGVLGACLAFSDHPHSSGNFRALRRALGGPQRGRPSFETVLPVERVGGTVVVPRVREQFTFPLESQRR